MKIKEVEECLQVPRATIRFYEKEGLINPKKGENGYREYSDQDILILKKIIVLRKLGFSVADIEDVLDRAKPLSEVVTSNIANLENQIEELQGALKVCRKLQEAREEIETFDQDKYWSVIEEEEKQGNRFLDIARDVARFEKGVLLEYFGLADENGKLSAGVPHAMISLIAALAIFGLVKCIFKGEFSWPMFASGVFNLLFILCIEVVVALPIYFIGRKKPEAIKNRKQFMRKLYVVLMIVCLIILALCFIFGWN